MNRKRIHRVMIQIVTICIVCSLFVSSNVLYTMITKKHLRSGISIEPYTRVTPQTEVLLAKRGSIYDQNGNCLVEDTETYTIYAILDETNKGTDTKPFYVEDLKEAAQKLAPFLQLDEEHLYEQLKQAKEDGQFQVEFGEAGKQISTETMQKIKALNLSGIAFQPSLKRNYLQHTFASHLLGYATYDGIQQRNIGNMGLEKQYEDILTGTNGEQSYLIDITGAILPDSLQTTQAANAGHDLYLTLDLQVQTTLEQALQDTMKAFKSRQAWGIIMEVETGRILGYASYPSFDPNQRDIQSYVDLNSAYAYEPGSVMKAFPYAAAMDSKHYPDSDTTYQSGIFYIGMNQNKEVIRSAYEVAGYGAIQDAFGKNYGRLTFEDGFLFSSNIAVCELLTRYMKPSVYEEYLTRFGFFQDMDMPEVEGQSGVKHFTYPIEKLSLGFGQGSSVTALQLMQAYSAFFNDGNMVKPYIVERIVNPQSQSLVWEAQTEIVGTPISQETAQKMKELLYGVVNDPKGSGYQRFHREDVAVIGKTGTAEIAVNGSYDDGYYISSFMGAAPYEDPKVMMYYAFESEDVLYTDGSYFQSAFTKALETLGVLESDDATSPTLAYQEYAMPVFVNHSLAYAEKKLKGMHVPVIILGDGDTIVRQYPDADAQLNNRQTVILLTSDTDFEMPDLTGWTLKEVQQLSTLLQLKCTWEGSGVVHKQSIPQGSILQEQMTLHIQLQEEQNG